MAREEILICDKCGERIDINIRHGNVDIKLLKKRESVDINVIDLCDNCLREFVYWMMSSKNA